MGSTGQLYLFRQLHLFSGVAATTGAYYSYRKLAGNWLGFAAPLVSPPLKASQPFDPLLSLGVNVSDGGCLLIAHRARD